MAAGPRARNGTAAQGAEAGGAARARVSSTRPGAGVTSYDVARLAGVSQSAVSRCFQPGASVAPKTRAAIMSAATQLGYQPNAFAQGLISRRTRLVAVVISNLTNLYYPEVLAELNQQLAAAGLRTLLFALPHEGDAGTVLAEVWRHRVDGAIAAVRLDGAQAQGFVDRGIALVLYNRMPPPGSGADCVCCDSEAGEALLVDRLLAAGHRRFGLVAGPADSSVSETRLQAAAARLAGAGFGSVPMQRGDFSYEGGSAALHRLLAADPGLDAVICVNDTMAIGAIDCARDGFGRDVPNDLSVVGFDGVGPAGWASYRVTSIRQPVRRMTQAAVAMLVARVETPDQPAERRLFAGQLIVGRSARIE